MPGQSQMYLNVFKLESKFQDYLQGKPGSSAKLKQLKMGLLRALETGVTDPKLKRIASRIHGGRILLGKIIKTIKVNHALPKAVYDHVVCGAGIKNACSKWGCKLSDISAAKKLSSQLDRDLGSFSKTLDPAEKSEFAEVEADHEEIIVYMSERALEDILLASFECYHVPKTAKQAFTEVYGVCLGMVREEKVLIRGQGARFRRHVHVMRAAAQIRAKATKNAVWPNEKSLEAQLFVARSLFPHLEVVGDFHTHPYRKAKKLKKGKGWEFSSDDNDQIQGWVTEMRKKGHEPRVGLIVAIGKKGHAGQHPLTQSGLPNIKFLTIERSLIAMAGYRILKNGCHESNPIQIKLPTLIGA